MDGPAITTRRGRLLRARRIAGWALLAVGLALMAAWATGWWRWAGACRWCKVRLSGTVVSVVWGDAEGQQQYRNWEMAATTWLEPPIMSALPPGSPVSYEGWRPRVPDRPWEYWASDAARLPSRVVVVRFPVWPLMVGSLVIGGALAWSARPPSRRGPGQRRMVIGAVTAAAGVWLGAMWVVSGWGSRSLDFAPLNLTAIDGLALVYVPDDAAWFKVSTMMQGRRSGPRWQVWEWSRSSGVATAPLWPFAGALMGAGWLLASSGWRARRGPGSCRQCGYDLRGTAAGAVCPECGEKAKTT